jgi:hypothetical protein
MTITPEDAEVMVALALEQAARITYRDVGGWQDLHLPGGACTAIRALRPDAFAALADLRKADRAEIERLTRERDEARTWLGAANNEFGSAAWDWPDLWRRIAKLKELSNERWQRAEAAEARLTALEADRVKVAETALRMAARLVQHYLTDVPRQSVDDNTRGLLREMTAAILAITPAAVLAQAEKDADNG